MPFWHCHRPGIVWRARVIWFSCVRLARDPWISENVMAPYKGSLCPCFLSPWFLRVVMQYFGNELGNCLATWEIRLMMILTCNRKCRLTLPQARYCMTCQGHLILLFSTCTWSVNIRKSHGPLQRQLVSLLSVALVLESGHAVFWKWAWQLLGHLRDQINDDTDL